MRGTAGVYFQDANPPFGTVHDQKPGIDAWATLAMFAPDDIRMDLVEAAPNPMTVTLGRPAAAASSSRNPAVSES